MDHWVLMDPLGSPAEGDVLVRMEPEACLVRPEPRETEGLMVWLDFLVRRDTEVNLDPMDLPDPQERMEREETMERSGHGGCLVTQDLVDCWDLRDLRDLPDPLV